MAKYDQGGGCACGLRNVCDCDQQEKPMAEIELIPAENTHNYLICYVFEAHSTIPGYGWAVLELANPILTDTDLRRLHDKIQTEANITKVCVTSLTKLGV